MTTGIFPGLEAHAGRNLLLSQWDSPPALARALVRWAHAGRPLRQGARVIEPSAGIGNIAVAARDHGCDVSAIEVDPGRARLCTERGIATTCASIFDRCTPPAALRYEWALMNPPYEDDGELRHVIVATEWAARVAAIVRLDALASRSRLGYWAQVAVERIAVLVPRPRFGATGGQHDIAFIDVRARSAGINADGALRPRAPGEADTVALSWLEWEAFGA